METAFYYFDNWSGAKKSFGTLDEAVESAKKETGNVIYINTPDGNRIPVDASGFCPA